VSGGSQVGGWSAYPFDKVVHSVLLQKSKSAIFDACNPLKYQNMIRDKSVKKWFLQ
jgi:hypothetical protein